MRSTSINNQNQYYQGEAKPTLDDKPQVQTTHLLSDSFTSSSQTQNKLYGDQISTTLAHRLSPEHTSCPALPKIQLLQFAFCDTAHQALTQMQKLSLSTDPIHSVVQLQEMFHHVHQMLPAKEKDHFKNIFAPWIKEKIKNLPIISQPSIQGLRAKSKLAFQIDLVDGITKVKESSTLTLAVATINYQNFRNFANRYGHAVGDKYIEALAKELHTISRKLNIDDTQISIYHQMGKTFKIIYTGDNSQLLRKVLQTLNSKASRARIFYDVSNSIGSKVLGDSQPSDIHYYSGFVEINKSDQRPAVALAQVLNSQSVMAAKYGQLEGYDNFDHASSASRTTLVTWNSQLEDSIAQRKEGIQGRIFLNELQDMRDTIIPLHPLALTNIEEIVRFAFSDHDLWKGKIIENVAYQLLTEYLRPSTGPDQPIVAQDHAVCGIYGGDELFGIRWQEDGTAFLLRGDINEAGALNHIIKVNLDGKQRDGADVFDYVIKGTSKHPGIIASIEDVWKNTNHVLNELRSFAVESFKNLRRNTTLQVQGRVKLSQEYLQGIDIHNLANKQQGQIKINQQWYPIITQTDAHNNASITITLPHKVITTAIRAGYNNDLHITIPNTRTSISLALITMHPADLSVIFDSNNFSTSNNVPYFFQTLTDELTEMCKTEGKLHFLATETYNEHIFIQAFTLQQIKESYPLIWQKALANLAVPYENNAHESTIRAIRETMLARDSIS